MEDYWNLSMEQYWPIAPPFDPRCTCYGNTPHGVSQDPIHYNDLKDKQGVSFVGHSGSSLKGLDENDTTTAASDHCSSSTTDKGKTGLYFYFNFYFY